MTLSTGAPTGGRQLALSRTLEATAPNEAAALRRDAWRLGLPSELPYLGR